MERNESIHQSEKKTSPKMTADKNYETIYFGLADISQAKCT